MLDPKLKKRLVHEDRWSRIYEAGENFYASESKFEADGLSVSIEELVAAWGSWDSSDKLRFVNAYRSKTKFVESDQKILDFLMATGDEPVLSTIASLLALYHPNKTMILEFLLRWLNVGSEPKSNFIQALYLLGDLAALPRLHELHDRLANQLNSVSRDQLDYWTINDFLRCCEALAYLEKPERYRDEIRPFLHDPNELIRIHAEMALAGPQPEEFGIS